MIIRVLRSQTKTITFAALILAISSLISRFLGLVRDRLLAGNFGAGEELDVYFTAFRIPDFVYGILILGGITAAFLPVFSQYFHKEDKETHQWSNEVIEFTNNVLNCFLILLVLICGILAIFTPFIIKLIVPGFSSENITLTIALTRLMFLSPILFGLSSIFSGILHYFNRFLIYSLAPILYNLGIIFGIIFLVPTFGIFGLGYGVILGAFLHLVIQIPAAKFSGYKYRPVFNFRFPGIKKIFKLMIPRIIGSTAYHINLIVITAIASTLTIGSISVFNFSNNLQYFPIGIIGISFAISSFPIFARLLARNKKEEFLERFSSTFRQILFFIIPISFLMFLLRAQIVRLILGTGEFGWLETRLTAASLGIFCFGIFGASLIPLIVRVFFALQNTKTPVLIAISSMVVNVIFSFLFVSLLGYSNIFRDFFVFALNLKDIENIQVIGLALALSVSALFQLILLLIFLYKKIGNFKIKEISFSLVKILSSSIIMACFSYFVRQRFANSISALYFWGIFWQTFFTILIGVLIYYLFNLFFKSKEIETIKLSFLKQFNEKH
ncbi:MAG: murein biosynthesis integral membrane protein MurJ [Candidatus Nealsonbacteria bacterium]